MKKETLYAIVGIFFLTISACSVAVTIKYCNNQTVPIAKINFSNMMTYEIPAESPYMAARTYWELTYDWWRARKDEEDRQELIKEAQKELEEYDD